MTLRHVSSIAKASLRGGSQAQDPLPFHAGAASAQNLVISRAEDGPRL